MDDAASNLELQAVDPDIREYYTKHYATAYVSKLPILIHLTRQLRKLLEQAPNGEHGAKDGKGAQNDVEPQKLIAEAGGGALVAVNRLAELLGKGGGECSPNLLMQLAVRLRGVAKELHELGDWLADVQAGLGVAAHVGTSAVGGETVKAGTQG